MRVISLLILTACLLPGKGLTLTGKAALHTNHANNKHTIRNAKRQNKARIAQPLTNTLPGVSWSK